MSKDPSYLAAALANRTQSGLLRQLVPPSGLVDLCSNDYLGFSRNRVLFEAASKATQQDTLVNGASGSRLLSGHSKLAEQVEQVVAHFHQAETALLFNSGYDANIGLLSSVPQRQDTILYDERIHASLKDGARLSLAKAFSFRHNDLEHLQQKLSAATGSIFVVTESLFSMDGDLAPLKDLVALVQGYPEAYLIVDEAHASGVLGPEGKGLVVGEGLADKVFARIHTFGKALGAHGAAVLGSMILKQFLINHARSFIYTTALPPHTLHTIHQVYTYLPQAQAEREQLHHLIAYFTKVCAQYSSYQILPQPGPIQTIVTPGNEAVRQKAQQLQAAGLDVRPILSPTVPVGTERLRVCLHSFNTTDHLDQLFETLQQA